MSAQLFNIELEAPLREAALAALVPIFSRQIRSTWLTSVTSPGRRLYEACQPARERQQEPPTEKNSVHERPEFVAAQTHLCPSVAPAARHRTSADPPRVPARQDHACPARSPAG
jgi:hypothetical protein